jgi:hypothetical protein
VTIKARDPNLLQVSDTEESRSDPSPQTPILPDGDGSSVIVPRDAVAPPPHKDDGDVSRQSGRSVRRQTLLLATACATLGSLCLVLWNSTRALAGELETRQMRAQELMADVRAVTTLRRHPQQASETELLRSDLLERVSQAMKHAQLSAETLVSTLPQPPRTRPGSEHAEVVNRLMFENVSLEQLVRFCHELTSANSELHVAAVQLCAGNDRNSWNADVSVSYWILGPYPHRLKLVRLGEYKS